MSECERLRAEVARLRAVLIEADHRACQMRNWDGREWTWHSFHAKAIHHLTTQAVGTPEAP